MCEKSFLSAAYLLVKVTNENTSESENVQKKEMLLMFLGYVAFLGVVYYKIIMRVQQLCMIKC